MRIKRREKRFFRFSYFDKVITLHFRPTLRESIFSIGDAVLSKEHKEPDDDNFEIK